MTFHKLYHQQVALLLEVLPIINEFDCFALKGGTAINLFIQNMPRLSVDIDLQYIPIEPRNSFMKNIKDQLDNLKTNISNQTSHKVETMEVGKEKLIKFNIISQFATIKIEPNFVQRGSVFPSSQLTLCKKAQDKFLLSFKTKCLSVADVYGGKLVAAFDRQHPRDLFDLKLLLEDTGITEKIRKAFLVYLACSPRPMNEVLNPNNIDIETLYNKEFVGMVDSPINLKDLLDAKHSALHEIKKNITPNEIEFLLSIKRGKPLFEKLEIPGIEDLPALKW